MSYPDVAPGRAHPIGARVSGGGVNFSVFSEHASAVELLLFARHDNPVPDRVVPMVREFHFWHVFVPGVLAGVTYAYRAYGPRVGPFAFDHEKVLLDPYARAVSVSLWDRGAAARAGGNVATSLRSTVIDPVACEWAGDLPLGRPLDDTIIYELHVGGFTRSPTSGVAAPPGTFAGLQEKIPYLVDLGVTAVELLPIFQFDGTTGDFWGYNPIGHFAPHNDYGSIDEFRDLVKALHRAGLEIILDVVFNHTGESGGNGPTISLRGLGNESYYMLTPQNALLDFSGCGNTLNVNNPITAKLVFDCLCYWVEELHVDGFRFDEGTILTRGPGGAVMQYPPIVALTELADQLGDTKLIAEAWDAGGLYEVGSFPGRRWSEWNGRFRDDVRRFVRGDPGLVGAIATRIAGSSDLYGWAGRPPQASINFVTCHDGFTMNDLVSYDSKHNEANGEGNRDGINDNVSWNHGAEGDTDYPLVEALRERQIRNFAVILLVSQGVPMILAGDEGRRTQHGNNNPWNQDNETSWVDWDRLAANKPLWRFWKLLIEFRKRHPALRSQRFTDLEDMRWHGCLLNAPGWNDPLSRVLAFTLGDIHIILNMDNQELDFQLPSGEWRRAFDTALASPEDASQPGTEPPVTGGFYRAGVRSAVVLVKSTIADPAQPT